MDPVLSSLRLLRQQLGPSKLPASTPGTWLALKNPDLVGYGIHSSLYGVTETLAFVEGIWPEQEADAVLLASAPQLKALVMAVLARPYDPPTPALLAAMRDTIRETETPLAWLS